MGSADFRKVQFRQTDFAHMEQKINRLKVLMLEFDLQNMHKLVKALRIEPQKLFTIHIAGSNGKGSVAAFVSSILTHAGYTTGTYISPHVFDITERIKINNKNMQEKEFARIAAQVFDCMEKNNLQASYFEFLTAMAFVYFEEKKVDFCVAEVGMGGRLDATNMLHGKINVFTSISLEHTQTLGKTIEKIAKEKAGIIKDGSVSVIAQNNLGLKKIEKIAAEKNSRIVKVQARQTAIDVQKKWQEFELEKPAHTTPFRISLLGVHQTENAALAVTAIKELEKLGFQIPQKALTKGLLLAKNPGRLEVMQKKPLVVIDCAHNPGGFVVLTESIKMFEYERLFLVFSCMDDKDWKKMLAHIPFDGLFVSKVKNEPRALDPHEIKKAFPHAHVFPSIKSALLAAKKKATSHDLVLVAGSIYGAAEAMKVTREKK